MRSKWWTEEVQWLEEEAQSQALPYDVATQGTRHKLFASGRDTTTHICRSILQQNLVKESNGEEEQ